MLDAHDALAEIEPLGIDVEHDRLRPGQLDELECRQPDRAGADDQARFFARQPRTRDRMAADGERLDQGELIVRQRARHMQLAGWDQKEGPQAAVAVNAERLMFLAAVVAAATAGVAGLAIDVGLDRTAVAGLHVRDAATDREHLNTQFMPGNTRVTEERHFAEKPGVLGTEAIKWNFTKFLAGRDGAVVKRFAPNVKPEDIEPEISQITDSTIQIAPGSFAPIIDRRKASTAVAVRDGETVVIGGLIRTSEN